MFIELLCHIMLQFCLQGIELSLRLLVVVFKLRRLHQFVKLFLADGVIRESTLDYPLFEFLEVGIRQMELRRGSYRRPP